MSEVLAYMGVNCRILNVCLTLSSAVVIMRMAEAALVPVGPQLMQVKDPERHAASTERSPKR
eukprot:5840017-Pyramimonas_sp.AAC.1